LTIIPSPDPMKENLNLRQSRGDDMEKSPKTGLILAGIISLIFCLTLAAGLYFFYQEGKQVKDYQAEDRPEGVAYNYLMALVKKDFARAYGYVSPDLSGYPLDVDDFLAELEDQGLLPAYEIDPCVYTEGVKTDGDQAEVELRVQYYDPCLKGWWLEIENLTQTPGQLTLKQVGESWMIIDADDWFFFSNCWVDVSHCE
jgi:hypothetical protein